MMRLSLSLFDLYVLEQAYLECIHLFVEILDHFFSNVCELDLVFNFHKVYLILDEFILAGELQETSKREGWCHGIGSVQQIPAKLMKRPDMVLGSHLDFDSCRKDGVMVLLPEAAAKQERSMEYALPNQAK